MQPQSAHSSAHASIDAAILAEAVDWLIRFQSDEAGERERHAFDRWLHTSDMHGAAWQRAEELMRLFGKTPPGIGHATLRAVAGRGQRRGMSMLGLLMVMMPLAEAMWRGESGSG